jgi:hypothetical protein
LVRVSMAASTPNPDAFRPGTRWLNVVLKNAGSSARLSHDSPAAPVT